MRFDSRGTAARAGFTGLLLLIAMRSQADVTLVAEIKATGMPPQSRGSAAQTPGGDADDTTAPTSVRTLTLFVRDKMTRAEITGGPVTLYDGVANKVFVLNPEQKTYAAISLKQALEADLTGAGFASPERMETTVDLDPTGLTGTALDRPTVKYTLLATGSVTIRPLRQSDSQRRTYVREMTVFSIKDGPLDDALFTTPKDYVKVDFAALRRQIAEKARGAFSGASTQ